MRLAPVLLVLLAACTDDSDTPSSPEAGPTIPVDLAIPADAEFVSGRILVGFETPEIATTISLDAGSGPLEATRTRAWSAIRAGAYELPDGVDVREAVERLRAEGRYRWVEPDYIRTISASVDDPYRSYQWNLDAVNAETAWDYSTGSGTVVAVIDTGVTSGPYDGIGNLGSGYDFVNGDSDPSDDNGHGTHVAGTIGAATNNTAGVAGLAYDCTIMPVKVMDASGSGTASDVVSGINYAVSNGADVINMSLGSTWSSSTEAAAVLNAYNSGVFVAAASGNSAASSVEYPGAYTGVVAVGATDYSDTRAWYSNTGSALDLMAPGGDVYVDDNGDGYADGILQETFDPSWTFVFWEGTSMATPHVAAAAALLMANGASNTEAESYLANTATDLGSSGWDSTNGYGLIQPDAALVAWAADNADTGDTGDTADTGTSCSTSAVTADYDASQGQLTTEATAASSSETLTVSADGNSLGTLTWDATDSQFEETWTWPVAPDEVVFESDCGDSSSLSVTVN